MVQIHQGPPPGAARVAAPGFEHPGVHHHRSGTLRRYRRLLSCAALLAAPLAAAQTGGVLQIDGDLERFAIRQHTLGRLPDLDVGAQPFNARRVLAQLEALADADGVALTAVDRRLLDGFLGRARLGLLGDRVARRTPFYRDGRSPVSAEGDGYGLEASPLLDLSAGPALVNRPASDTETGAVWRLSRGARVAGHAGRLFAEARVTENQERVPLGTREFRNSPRQAYTVTTGDPDPTYDYLRSTGLVGYRDRFVEVRAGRDRNRLGFARGSLILSDYAAEYNHVQVRANVGPASIQAVYARFLDPPLRGVSDGDRVIPNRYGAFHRVSVRPGAGVELELFESAIFGDRDGDGRKGFELGYLVPLNFYRAEERDLGSPDNILLGAGAAWQPAAGTRLYAQGLLDELVASEFFDDAWTSKWGFVLGTELADPRLPVIGRLADTDVRVEYARIRPYTYAHRGTSTAAVHYGDGLGHPAGPNVSDLTLRLAHRPSPDVELSTDVAWTVRGRNTEAENFGSDPTRPYGDRVPEPNPTLQGVRQRVLTADASASLRVLPDAQLGLMLRTLFTDDALDGRSGVVAPSVFLRWGLAEFGRR